MPLYGKKDIAKDKFLLETRSQDRWQLNAFEYDGLVVNRQGDIENKSVYGKDICRGMPP